MEFSALNRFRRNMTLVMAVALVGASTGCVGVKYRRTEKPTSPVELTLRSAHSPLETVVQSVIVFQGPGSWKREAYWDEYCLTFINPGPEPIIIERAALIDVVDQSGAPATDPWQLEKLSRENLRKYERYGGRIAVRVGLGVAWGASPAITLGGALAGSSTMAVVGVTTFFAVPAVVVSTVVMSKHARRSIEAEFEHRRIPLPFDLAPDSVRSGSLFFPVTPVPQRLVISGHMGTQKIESVIELQSLADLHLLKSP